MLELLLDVNIVEGKYLLYCKRFECFTKKI